MRLNRAAPFARAAGVMATTATLFAVSALIPEATKHDAYPGKKPAVVDQYHDPKVAGMALAHRYASCKLTVHDTHAATKKDSVSPAAVDTVNYQLDLSFQKDVQPYYAAFINDDHVRWGNTDILYRGHLVSGDAGYSQPVAVPNGPFAVTVPTKNGAPTAKLDPLATGTQVNGAIDMHRVYDKGMFFDIWADESTLAKLGNDTNRVSINALYCGRMVMGEENGTPTWQLDTSHSQPLQQPQEIVSYNSNDYYTLPLRLMWPGQANQVPAIAADAHAA